MHLTSGEAAVNEELEAFGEENTWVSLYLQVSVLEAEACQKDLEKAQEALDKLMPGTRRLSFDQIYK